METGPGPSLLGANLCPGGVGVMCHEVSKVSNGMEKDSGKSPSQG